MTDLEPSVGQKNLTANARILGNMDWGVGWSLRKKGTQLYTRLYFEPVTAVQAYETRENDVIPVFWFSDDTPMFGQVTFFRTIILNEAQMAAVSDLAREYVVQHELGHLERGPIRKAVFWGLIGFCFALSWMAFVGALALVQSGSSPMQVLVLGLVILSSLLTFVLASRIDETAAELFALRRLGKGPFLESKREIRTPRDGSVVMRVFAWLMYPRPDTVVHIDESVRRVKGYFD